MSIEVMLVIGCFTVIVCAFGLYVRYRDEE